MLSIGVLALQGGVAEHIFALREAGEKTKIPISIRTVRTRAQLEGLDALLLPGGESTTLGLLLQKQGMPRPIASIPHLFGTCAGLILMAKDMEGGTDGQRGLGLMDVSVSRNAYGPQAESFESRLDWAPECAAPGLARTKIIFIRAPKITRAGGPVKVLARLPSAQNDGEPVIVMQKMPGRVLLGSSCHPELTTARVHEFFLKQILEK